MAKQMFFKEWLAKVDTRYGAYLEVRQVASYLASAIASLARTPDNIVGRIVNGDPVGYEGMENAALSSVKRAIIELDELGVDWNEETFYALREMPTLYLPNYDDLDYIRAKCSVKAWGELYKLIVDYPYNIPIKGVKLQESV